jgi:hypothetical protein
MRARVLGLPLHPHHPIQLRQAGLAADALEAWSGRGARLDVVVLSRLYREVARDLSLLLTENPPSEGDVLPGAALLLLLRLRLLLCVWFLLACVCLLFARFGVRVFVRVYVCTRVRACPLVRS